MDHFETAISFEVPTNMNFDTFSSSSLHDRVNDSVTIIGSQKSTEIAVSNNGDGLLMRKLSEKLGRGLSSSEVSMIRNQVVLNGSNFGVEEWQKQMEYDKFMNEIWIGIVLTLIVISLVFCICSCFLYHQFRHWKRNYRQNVRQNYDIESAKLNMEEDDPVPSYTLVSGLPTYDAALEQLRKSSTCSSSTLIDYPSVYKVFSVVEKSDQPSEQQSVQQLQQQHQHQQQSQQQQQQQQSQQQQQQQQISTQQKIYQKSESIPTYEEATEHPDEPERTSSCEKKLLEIKT